MATEKRTDQEILERVKAIEGIDFLGFKAEVLVPYLSFEYAKPYLVDTMTAEEWERLTAEISPPAQAGAEYVPFAIGKMEDERGISASRSVQKLAEWAWLDGEDELAEQMDDEDNYGWYGDRAVRLYTDRYGIEWKRGEE